MNSEVSAPEIDHEVVVDLIGKIGDVTTKNAKYINTYIGKTKIPVADVDTMIRTKQGLRERDKDDLIFLRLKKKKRK